MRRRGGRDLRDGYSGIAGMRSGSAVLRAKVHGGPGFACRHMFLIVEYTRALGCRAFKASMIELRILPTYEH